MSTIDDITVPWSIARSPAPWVRGGPGGREGEITFLVDLNDLAAFATTLAGESETILLPGGTSYDRIVPMRHPDDPEMLAMGYHAEAIGTPNGAGASVHSLQFSKYKVRVDFATLPFGVGGDTAYYTITTDAAEQFETVPNVTLHFTDGTTPTGEFGFPFVLVGLTMTTFLSLTPITYSLAALAGKINSVVFDDFPPYTLRFTGVKTDYARGSLTRSLVKSYSMQFRDPHWNKMLRADGVWDVATIGATGVGRALTADLNQLKYL